MPSPTPRRPADCHPGRPSHARGKCVNCYARDYTRARRNHTTPPGWRPLIDLDLGHACQYGYHRPAVRVVDGPPDQLDGWISRPRITAAVAKVLSDGAARTTTELADDLGLTEQERYGPLARALARMAESGDVHRLPRPGKSTIWRLAA
ncbi:hypothetical protein O7626_39560 [Micromonospora sp. WMMD1102]|uniref:hypothetical protein n=1 Tax=Micromonospora sp. WMMD1102 TaxID=3016105 RepID=UPI00241546BC|nr:hypothetical protein [Micromonospora sp. WMMD1102]MDG4784337.1 hypothetical protein [Micromonospora sp. WMMD1102]MDG4784410.1 hypothetical protein [Micromonospora sp. WMMD1102]MDG4791914.1 hypothetical protein [Micromonospora sp. WMMD1102]